MQRTLYSLVLVSVRRLSHMRTLYHLISTVYRIVTVYLGEYRAPEENPLICHCSSVACDNTFSRVVNLSKIACGPPRALITSVVRDYQWELVCSIKAPFECFG